MLESKDEEIPNTGVNVTLHPALNSTDDVTDEDSGAEENPSIDKLPASQLNATALCDLAIFTNGNTVNATRKQSFTFDVVPGPSSSTKRATIRTTTTNKPARLSKNKVLNLKKYNWKSCEIVNPTPVWPLMFRVGMKKGRTPLEYFQQFFDNEVLLMMVTYTNQYADKRNGLGDCSEDEMFVFIAILLLSGYVTVSRRKMYWQSDKDSHNDLVTNAMFRDRFDFIFSNLHVCNNDNLDKSDCFGKIHPLLRMLNDKFKQFAPHVRHHSVDESMVPYFGSHGCKQFIKGKPIRYGFKFWCGGTSGGYIIWLEPYQGAGTCSKDYETKGMGYGVVMTYVDQLLPHVPYRIYFDNLFTSVELLHDLKERGVEATGTIRGNRVKNCTLSPVEKMIKENRGSYEVCSDSASGISIVRWNDNNAVTVATNFDRVQPLRSVARFSREQKKRINVPQPNLLHSYNTHMGGIDRADQNVSLYRCSIRGKKWYFPIIAHFIDIAEQNALDLYKHNEEPIDHLTFRRVTAILESHKRVTTSRGCRSKRAKLDSRFDGREHYVAELPTDEVTKKKKQLKC
ncbi:piggyBac transposable element-derived protein 3-like [Schistocerca nitens]|uniref:piggyBac transposable element-derived protein 3-like n=1 Tax=Schistocerca nitens TaxID=7011 RepID=UPI00211847C4|nr:piggyBac transposable element-derived protein 3-like [Schistocerca nitens]